MNKLIIILVVILLFGVGSYFIFNQQNQQSSITENEIVIKNFAFTPTALIVKTGTTVIWLNDDPVPHSIKSDTFNSEIFNKGESFQFKFDNTGTYDYTCGPHPTMIGEIIVQD